MRILVFIFFFVLVSCGPKTGDKVIPKAVNGVLDLSNWDFKKNGPIQLKGEWHFFWNHFIDPVNIPKEDGIAQVPGPWTNVKLKNGENPTPAGYASYVLKVRGLKEGQELGIKSNFFFSNYNLYKVDKEKVQTLFKVGFTGKTKATTTPQFKIDKTSFISNDSVYFVFHGSNFHYRVGGLLNFFELGLKEDLFWVFDFQRYRDIFVIGILLIMGLYHLGLFQERREDKSSLFFGLFCGLISIRLIVESCYLFWLFKRPSLIIFELSAKISYLTLIFQGPLFISFLNQALPKSFDKVSKYIYYPSYLITPFIIFLPAYIYAQAYIVNFFISTIIIFIMYSYFKVAYLTYKKTPFSKLIFVGLNILVLGAVHDILVWHNILSEPNLFPFFLCLFTAFQSYILSINFSNAFKKSETLSAGLEKVNANLEELIHEATEDLRNSLNESRGMLTSIDKAIFCVDQRGKIFQPISKYSKEIFGKDILGLNSFNLLFFNFKDEEKKSFLASWKILFGCTESEFLFNSQELLPQKVLHPDLRKRKGRTLSIQYIPLCKNDESLEKVLFIVDDITEVEEESNKNKEISIDYEALLEVLPFKDKEKLSKDLSKIIGESISSLEIMMSPNATDLSVEQIDQILFTLFHNFNKSLCSQLKLPEEEITMTIRDLRNVQKYEKNKLLAWSVEKLSNLFLLLMRYVDSLNILHKNNLGPKVTYSLPRGFDKSIQDKREDLDRIMVNLLEYVFLVRKVNDLDKDKMANAPKKARLYAHFDETISLLLNRSRLLAFLLKISGQEELSTYYFELSELLRQMPNKDKLNEASLVNHLIRPYKKVSRK